MKSRKGPSPFEWIIGVVVVILYSPVILFMWIANPFLERRQQRKAERKAKEFSAANENCIFFFYRTKRGWGDFVKNNIIPVLPEGTIVFNTRDKSGEFEKVQLVSNYGRHPFIIKFGKDGPIVVSLHAKFAEHRKYAATNPVMQEEIRKYIDENL